MTTDRRRFLTGIAALVPALTANSLVPASAFASSTLDTARSIRPYRLRAWDQVRLIAPAGVIYKKIRIQIAMESVSALGFIPTLGKHVHDRYGYFAGTDADRAADIMDAFQDPGVKGIFALVGGWGSARTLPHLDFDVIKANPKILMGYSDLTALLNAVYAKTGLTTFHGPNATTQWDPFSVDSFKRTVAHAEQTSLVNPQVTHNSLVARRNRIQTLQPGTAEGILVGGNLTVFASLVGTPYMPDMAGKILFLEDIGEDVYRVDRMLSTLMQAGIFDQIAGLVYGGFTRVHNDGEGYGSFALMDIFEQYAPQINVPCFYGAMIGHVPEKQTVPIGIRARMDADKGTITLLESAVL